MPISQPPQDMGITGLHPIIKPILKRKPISAYKNKRIGIDGHAWLYQIGHMFAEHIYHNLPLQKHAHVFVDKIKKLIDNKIKPIVVFDGDPLKAKEITNNERKEKKELIKKEISRCLSMGNTTRAKMLMKQCISISNDLLRPVLDALISENIEFMVAPFETDAQLRYLQKIGYIDCIFTEDSDLFVFGATKILYKYDGSKVLEYDRLHLSHAKDDFFAEKILEIAILAGCDYLKSIKGVGLLTAYKLLQKHKTVEKVVEFLEGSKEIPEEYLTQFQTARLNFLYHIVYDPLKKTRVHLNDPMESTVDVSSILHGLTHHDPSGHSEGKYILRKNVPLETVGAIQRKERFSGNKIISKKLTMHRKSGKTTTEKPIVVDGSDVCPLFDDI